MTKTTPSLPSSDSAPNAFAHALLRGSATLEEALSIFDELPTVPVEFMLGSWKGAGFPTGHPLDGVLETYHWHGKRFDSPEHVHPLVFRGPAGKLIHISPPRTMPGLGLLDRLPGMKSRAAGGVVRLLLPLLTTRRSAARLRETAYRGKTSATMVYDQLPIHDVFRKVDDDTVLGVMDLKGMKRPFFFVLRRE